VIDNTYKKQLEQFGIESVRVTEGDLQRQQKAIESESTLLVVKTLMERMEGRQWLYSKLDMCGVFTAPIVPGDPYGAHVLMGIQAVGQNLLNDIMRSSPENFYLMTTEAAARKQGHSAPESN